MSVSYSKQIVLVIFSLLFIEASFAKTKNKLDSTHVFCIPFELTAHNNIVVKGVLNNKDTLRLMFHTAADALSLTRKALQKVSPLNWDNTYELNTWGGETNARFSSKNTLQLGGLKWEQIGVWENERSGPTTDGKFGPNLFEGKAIAVDFDREMLLIYNSMPQKVNDFIKLKLCNKNDLLFITAVSSIQQKEYTHDFLIHSGYGGTVLLDDEFVSENQINTKIIVTAEKELKDAYGNRIITKKATVDKFTIGGVSFEKMPVGFFEGKMGKQQISIVGGDILKRFNFILSPNRDYIYIQTSKWAKSAYAMI